VFITGIPGAGKTTLAGRIARRTGRYLLSAHDLVDLVDPGAILDGRMADEAKMQSAFTRLMEIHAEHSLVVDGWPRNSGQASMLPEGSIVIHLRVGTRIARERLLKRGRLDDVAAIIDSRLSEQVPMFDGPWARAAAPWERTLNTDKRTADYVETTVMRYLTGASAQVF
jgi:broad-specificity NMP kinase